MSEKVADGPRVIETMTAEDLKSVDESIADVRFALERAYEIPEDEVNRAAIFYRQAYELYDELCFFLRLNRAQYCLAVSVPEGCDDIPSMKMLRDTRPSWIEGETEEYTKILPADNLKPDTCLKIHLKTTRDRDTATFFGDGETFIGFKQIAKLVSAGGYLGLLPTEHNFN
jgi:hypothetical protein